MKYKKIILFSLISLLSTGCSKSYFRYGVKKPYIELENSASTSGELKELKPSEVILKVENQDTFMLYVHSQYCSHCFESEENFLNPYLEKHNYIIYGIDIGSLDRQDDEYKEYYVNEVKPLFKDQMKGTPFYALFQNGVYINGEQDSSYFSLFFDTYIIN